MIAIDTSAIIAIARDEPEAIPFTRLISENTCIVGTPILLEAHLVLSTRLGSSADFFQRFLGPRIVRPVAFTLEMFAIAQQAFDQFGKGGGSGVKLNFGDCMSYAVAKAHGASLLFKGSDFAQTDITPAHIPA